MTSKEFWDWFLTRKAKLEKFAGSDAKDLSLYHELIGKVKSYNNLLVPELTTDSEDNHILILSCDGRRDGITPVEKLYDSAPSIDKWKIQKFRAPGHVTELNYQGLAFKSTDIKVKCDFDGDRYNIELYIKGYSDADVRYKGLAFLYLDHLVGEYNVMTRIGHIEFKKPEPLTGRSAKVSLQELRATIEGLN